MTVLTEGPKFQLEPIKDKQIYHKKPTSLTCLFIKSLPSAHLIQTLFIGTINGKKY